jgi:hypothetical protein
MMGEVDKAIADAALDTPSRVGRLQIENKEIALWHLLRALLEWCDAQHPRIDFDVVLEEVRADFRTGD